MESGGNSDWFWMVSSMIVGLESYLKLIWVCNKKDTLCFDLRIGEKWISLIGQTNGAFWLVVHFFAFVLHDPQSGTRLLSKIIRYVPLSTNSWIDSNPFLIAHVFCPKNVCAEMRSEFEKIHESVAKRTYLLKVARDFRRFPAVSDFRIRSAADDFPRLFFSIQKSS